MGKTMIMALLSALIFVGCEQGDTAINLDSQDITTEPPVCGSDGECSPGEICVQGICSIDQSAPDSSSTPDGWETDAFEAQDSSGDSTCEPGSGCLGELCGSGEDCISGICTTHQGEKQCTKTCEESCPDGWSCMLVGDGQDAQYVCVANAPKLCLPCSSSEACQGRHSFGALETQTYWAS